MTQNRLMVAFDSQKGPNLKVVKWCWKRWNGPILVHIYAKQCEIIQKNQWKNSNFQIQCFYMETSGALCWKRRKTPKLGKLKHPLLNFFQIITPIQGCTMSKSMPGAFQICRTYGGGDDLTLSYGPPKSTQISIFFEAEMRCLKKKSRPQFAKLSLRIESAWN